MKYFNVNSYGHEYRVRIEASKYQSNGTLALSLITDTEEPYCNLTVNIDESIIWADDKTAFVDTNNCPWAEEFITKNGLGEFYGYNGRSGFCLYPLFKFNMDKIKEVSE